ncbi:hypothetical protein JDN40_04680 [Rhodomicrobium vannielii ATCC 17100]|uniref:hypothetical protein n=1 Tax=Rhodomicrobium vannielii TaxID=1069 RepID=UPI00191B39D8|nr:hypothetical protein [Rhodomicrobium vannielii]MBJ7533400.1 hypothetical protein [Rhodomicrobium vannielii ATCC 17100]
MRFAPVTYAKQATVRVVCLGEELTPLVTKSTDVEALEVHPARETCRWRTLHEAIRHGDGLLMKHDQYYG